MKLEKLFEKITPFDILTGALAVGSVVVSFVSKRRLNRACEKLDTTANELISSGVDNIRIAQSFVDDAVRNKVDREVLRMMPDAVNAGRREATRTFSDEVRKEIQSQYSDIKKSVTDKVMDEIEKLDLHKLKLDVIADAKVLVGKALNNEIEEAVDDFKDDLDNMLSDLKDDAEDQVDGKISDVIDRFEDRLDDVVKIYRTVATRVNERR